MSNYSFHPPSQNMFVALSVPLDLRVAEYDTQVGLCPPNHGEALA